MKLQLAKVIGHRGACGYAPENTITSMSKAKELGVQWVEFDVMLAGCGQPIIIHDTSLNRTTNGSGEVAKVDYQTIVTLDSGSWFAEQYRGEIVPTLQQLLDHVVHLNLAINVEIKPYDGFDIETATKTLAILENKWPVASSSLLVSSFSKQVIEFASQFHFPLGYVIDTWEGDWAQVLEKNHCVSLHVEQSILTEDRVKQIKDMGYLVLAYTVNERARAEQLYDWGVDSIFSDFPDRIR